MAPKAQLANEPKATKGGICAVAISALFVTSGSNAGVGAFLSPQTGIEALQTQVVVLGVEHSAQLVSPMNQPGALTAFIEKLHPNAICVERPPGLAEQGDFYEFTYEVQGIVLPYVSLHPTDVCPVDWMPPVEDQKLVFGYDLDSPPEIRSKHQNQGFLVFPDPGTLKADLFAADDPAITDPISARANKPADRADQDFARRLFLYRTFMQAQRIRAAAHAHPGGTVLVVIGYFHKPDIEAILSQDTTIQLRLPSSLERVSQDEIERATSTAQRMAILSFNLLGRQAETGNVDWTWMEQVMRSVNTSPVSPEVELFRTRLDQLTGKLTTAEAVLRYRLLAKNTPSTTKFTWTGAKDASRVDSYFDPFGNLSVRQRDSIELIRALSANGSNREAARILDNLGAELDARRSRQLRAYASDYLMLN